LLSEAEEHTGLRVQGEGVAPIPVEQFHPEQEPRVARAR
jgi:hypothetical protein